MTSTDSPANKQRLAIRTFRLEIPTLCVALAIHGGFIAWTWFFRELPLWIAAPLGSLLLTWYGSFQHETIHGHPTSARRCNAILGGLPLPVWIPYGLYRESHLRHHRHGGRHLTEVARDPESFYLRPGALSRVGRIRRAIHGANCTLAGRILLGPAVAIATFWGREARRVWSGDRRRARIWLHHALAVGVVLWWTVAVCHIPLIVYIALVIYPSVSLSQVRSFAEHRAHADSRLRTRVVETSPLWSLIFLNNNLHIAHHAQPNLPWYQLPRAWRGMRRSVTEPDLVFQGGYREVIRRYLFRPCITAEHPSVAIAND
jgi:fatty acid desaturase